TAVFKNKTKMLVAGLIYIVSVYITYFLLGIGLFTLAYTAGLAKPFYWFAAIIALTAGLLEIKDFFWYGKGFSLQMFPGAAQRIERYTRLLKNTELKHPYFGFVISAFLGVFVVFVELPCTGAPYLVILGLLSKGSYAAGIPLLLLYNLVFILPLFVIIGLVYSGHASKTLERWRKKHRGTMRLVIGLFLLTLGAYMIWAVL
ncbi:MAG: hypothetical protein AABX37_00695, partial [Nanoarchaeota archaeon]